MPRLPRFGHTQDTDRSRLQQRPAADARAPRWRRGSGALVAISRPRSRRVTSAVDGYAARVKPLPNPSSGETGNGGTSGQSYTAWGERRVIAAQRNSSASPTANPAGER